MNTLTAINLAAVLLQTAMNAMAAAAQVSAIITKAQAEGRTTLTAEEMAVVKGADDAARAALAGAINAEQSK